MSLITKSDLERTFVVLFFWINQNISGQVNLAQNGSFEALNNCSAHAKFWTDADTTQYNYAIQNYCLNNIPGGTSSDYQYPRSGSGLVATTFFNPKGDKWFNRGYLRNRLSRPLSVNTIYCVKFYINVRNYSPSGIDAIGAYFGDSSLDTIKYGNMALTYLTPQINNLSGNIITDTLNWIEISGTFKANGTEQFLMIGNFKSDASTNSSQIYPTRHDTSCDLLVEDVSVFEFNLSAWAGRDTSIMLGDSVYVGRPREFAMDEICQWFKLPNSTVAIDTAAGLWVKPTITSTYVVRQEICGNVKWDTVVVNLDYVGLSNYSEIVHSIVLRPNPASDKIGLFSTRPELLLKYSEFQILNNLGQTLCNGEFKQSGVQNIDVAAFPEGVHTLRLLGTNVLPVSKIFVVSR